MEPDKIFNRIEIKRRWLDDQRMSADKRGGWGEALEWAHSTLCALVEAEDREEVTNTPEVQAHIERMECDYCD